MRSLRLIASALGALATVGLTPAAGAAQQRAVDWRDSWYWGAYGGYTSFNTKLASTNAPTIGIDWVITRSQFALNLFAEQSYFNAVSTVRDFATAADRKVDITDMRRVGFSAMYFTPPVKAIKPYVGLGYAFNFIKTGNPQGSCCGAGAGARDSVLSRINSARSTGRMFGNLGLMATIGRFAPFAQYTVMPSQGNGSFFLNGEGFTNVWTAGVRYNIGSSIEK